MNLYTLAGLALSLLGCTCFYLASPNQRLLASSWRTRPACIVGAVLLVAGWFTFRQDMQRLPAIYLSVTMLMLMLAALPYAAVVLRNRVPGEAAHGDE